MVIEELAYGFQLLDDCEILAFFFVKLAHEVFIIEHHELNYQSRCILGLPFRLFHTLLPIMFAEEVIA